MFTIIGGDGREYGPVSAEQVRAWIVGGRADLETKAKTEGEAEWKTLGEYPEFAAAEPPPLVGVETPDLASRLSRLGARLIDWTMSALLALPGTLLIGYDQLMEMMTKPQEQLHDFLQTARMVEGVLVLSLGFFVYFVVQTWLLTARGQTLGKLLCHIQIVRLADGRPAGFVHAALLRSWLVFFINSVPYFGPLFLIADIAFIGSPDRRCLHDRIAGTRVVRV